MGVALFLALLLLAAVAAQLLRRRGITVLRPDGRRQLPAPGSLIRWLVLAALLLVLLLSIPASIRVVPVGHALVVFNTLSKSFRLARQGVTLVPPFITQSQVYDLRRLEYTMAGARGEGRRSQVDDSLWSPTREGLQVGIDITVWHHLQPDRVVDIHQRIGPDYEEKIIRPAVRSVIRLVISEYAVMDVYSSKRSAIQDEINAKIKQLVEKDGFLIDEVVLRDVRFTDDFAKAIEAKQIAQQAAEQMKYVLEKEQREAERKVIEAQGRARAIETVTQALQRNPNYIKYLYVDKLSDKISVIISDQNTIMDLKGILEPKAGR
ncbi:MAG TPA: prohibitin family protein [Candidatus Polarisedimenticolia bacterium]|jgi:regulator of protease activity HflC (stomatin/prohibitin superfamily)|nr:prohibitin family protein [Candidatus Polarisedimenticolia bacterium]